MIQPPFSAFDFIWFYDREGGHLGHTTAIESKHLLKFDILNCESTECRYINVNLVGGFPPPIWKICEPSNWIMKPQGSWVKNPKIFELPPPSIGIRSLFWCWRQLDCYLPGLTRQAPQVDGKFIAAGTWSLFCRAVFRFAWVFIGTPINTTWSCFFNSLIRWGSYIFGRKKNHPRQKTTKNPKVSTPFDKSWSTKAQKMVWFSTRQTTFQPKTTKKNWKDTRNFEAVDWLFWRILRNLQTKKKYYYPNSK